MADVWMRVARWRVPLGFVATFAAFVLARPTWGSWQAGLAVSCVGEAIRVWAAGHLEKSREVTTSGPYRWTRHPLYLGSTLMAVGIVLATRSTLVAVLATVYMAVTLTAAIRTEEAFLRGAFGDAYDRYAGSRHAPMDRPFSLARALRNREYRAMVGLAIGFGLLALRVRLTL
jgi:protein-S-isoprenylcysteine O-methyltransferase Ste14